MIAQIETILSSSCEETSWNQHFAQIITDKIAEAMSSADLLELERSSVALYLIQQYPKRFTEEQWCKFCKIEDPAVLGEVLLVVPRNDSMLSHVIPAVWQLFDAQCAKAWLTESLIDRERTLFCIQHCSDFLTPFFPFSLDHIDVNQQKMILQDHIETAIKAVDEALVGSQAEEEKLGRAQYHSIELLNRSRSIAAIIIDSSCKLLSNESKDEMKEFVDSLFEALKRLSIPRMMISDYLSDVDNRRIDFSKLFPRN